MLADITQLELRLRRRSAIGYTAGMALYTLVVVALYPAFRNETSLNSLSGSTAAALFGVTGPLTSPGGWLNANIYANFFPLIMLLLTIGYGAASLAGQDEDGTLALVTALPVRRRAVLFQKAGAMAVQALLVAVAVTVCVLIGRGFQLTISPARTIAVSVAVMLMGLDFGLITMAAGAATGRRGTALGLGAGGSRRLIPAQLPRRHDLRETASLVADDGEREKLPSFRPGPARHPQTRRTRDPLLRHRRSQPQFTTLPSLSAEDRGARDPPYLHPPVIASVRSGVCAVVAGLVRGCLSPLPVPDRRRVLRAGRVRGARSARAAAPQAPLTRPPREPIMPGGGGRESLSVRGPVQRFRLVAFLCG